MHVAHVIIDRPSRSLDAPYSYKVPASLPFKDANAARNSFVSNSISGTALEVGMTVVVPFAGSYAVAFVVGLEEQAEQELKSISAIISRPFFDEISAKCALWMSQYYFAPLSSCIRLFVPTGSIASLETAPDTAEGWRLCAPKVAQTDDRWLVRGPHIDDYQPSERATRQRIIASLVREGEISVLELSHEYGNCDAAIKALERKGVLCVEHRRRFRGMDASTASLTSHGSLPLGVSQGPALTAEQKQAVEAILHARKAGGANAVLVDGVTGSGKTEVYLRAIEQVLKAGQNAIVLVPEIALTPQTLMRFRARFGACVGVMHSRMSKGERFDQWDFVRSPAARVVVGARSALFLPLRNVGLIVIDEEQEYSYKQDSSPRYHAREVAWWMARRTHATLVLGSATPSIESLYEAAHNPLWSRVCLRERANGKVLPPVEVIDMASEFSHGARSMFSRRLQQVLFEELGAGRKAVLFLNQRGFARFLLCRECGFVPECPNCASSLTFHERGNYLACHHCGYRISAPARCPACASPYLKRFGAGTQRVEDELRALLDAGLPQGNEIPIIRMDADTTHSKGAHHRLLEEFAKSGPSVLLGTQMIAKGLDFDEVTLVGVINADTQLHLPDFRSAERTFNLISQVAGRAGRNVYEGRVIVQSYEARSAAIRFAAAYDREGFLKEELPKRKLFSYPPYADLIRVLVWGKNEAAVRSAAIKLSEELSALLESFGVGGLRVFPATSCVLSKLQGMWRYHVLIKIPKTLNPHAALHAYFSTLKAKVSVKVAVDVHPLDLL